MALLELRGVAKRYQQGSEVVVALDGVDLDVDAGEHLALVGRSGSGKSTLLHLAGGLDQPDAGTVTFGGRDLSTMSVGDRAELRRKEIGFIFQFFHLIPTLTVAENVELPLLLDGARSSDGHVDALLERLGIGHRAVHLPAELSGGEMQRAAIARALVAKPRLLLADEPTGNLDTATGAVILDVLTEAVNDAGAALIVVTHDEKVAARASQVLHLQDGRLIDAPKRRRRAPAKAK